MQPKSATAQPEAKPLVIVVTLSATFEFKVSMLVKTEIGPRHIMEQLFVVAMVVVKTAVIAFVKQQLVGTFELMVSIAVATAVVV